eukprot:scaffold66225_cov39-Attheya_sp.AAC.5
MERDGSIAECIAAIEECESVSGLSKNDAWMGLMGVVDCERRRKESFRPTGILKFVEASALLGGGKNADTEANDVVYIWQGRRWGADIALEIEVRALNLSLSISRIRELTIFLTYSAFQSEIENLWQRSCRSPPWGSKRQTRHGSTKAPLLDTE